VDDEPDCLAIAEVNQQALFKRVAVVLHHGGPGTTPWTQEPVRRRWSFRRCSTSSTSPIASVSWESAGRPSSEPTIDSLLAALCHALDPGGRNRSSYGQLGAFRRRADLLNPLRCGRQRSGIDATEGRTHRNTAGNHSSQLLLSCTGLGRTTFGRAESSTTRVRHLSATKASTPATQAARVVAGGSRLIAQNAQSGHLRRRLPWALTGGRSRRRSPAW